MPAPWIEPLEKLEVVVNGFLDEVYQDVIDQAETDPENVLELSDDHYELLLAGMATAVDETHKNVVGGGPDFVDTSTISAAEIIGGYFLINAAKRAYHRLHTTTIARQLKDEDRKDAQISALKSGKDDMAAILGNELGETYHQIIKKQFKGKGVISYEWNHCLCGNERAEHLARHGETFDVGDPAGDEPGQAYNCRCYARELDTNSNSKGKIMAAFDIKAEGKAIQIDIRGPIYDDAWGSDEVGVNDIITALEQSEDVDSINLRVYSKGGDAFAGAALYSYLTNHPAKVTADIFGLAASAATMIAAAADEVTMGISDSYLIHNPWSVVMGDYKEIMGKSSDLKTLTETYAQVYAQRTGMDKESVLSLMSEDRIMSAQEALDKGFITQVREPSGSSACTDGFCAPRSAIKAMSKDMLERYGVRAVDGRIGRNASNITMPEFKQVKNSTDQDKNEMNLDELKAKVKELEAANGVITAASAGKDAVIEELRSSVLTDEQIKAMREEVRAEVLAETQEAEIVRTEAIERGFKAEGATGPDIMRSVINEVKADAAKGLEGDSLKNVYSMALESRAKVKAEDKGVDDAFDDSEGSDRTDRQDSPFGKMKKVGG
ncbi:MAG: hypothetical protein GKR96_04205 [Gammaproteobacteria bacterium]|nr:hypothetical protein [Gammaproteobacteria bacterium]